MWHHHISYSKGGQLVRDQEPHSYTVLYTTKNHIYMGTHENYPISSLLTHIPLLS